MKIKSVVRNETPTTVHDITVKDVHHYILENGIVSHNSYFPTKVMSGGSGLVYIADSIAMLSKSKDKDKDKKVIGSLIKVKMLKSRLSKENAEVEVKISYAGGLDRYHGLLEFAEEAGMVTSTAGKYTFPGLAPAKAAKIMQNPTDYFTPEFLKSLDETYVIPTFTYGVHTDEEIAGEEETQD